MSFDFCFFIFRLSNVLSVNTKSLFKVPSGLSNIFFIATAADNYIFKVGSFAIEIRDNIHFLNKWDRNTDGNTLIATFNVVGLYANISHNFEMEAVRYFLLKYKEDIHPSFNIPFNLESIDFTLKDNTGAFDN